jgi:VWFA-related protein
MKTARMSIALAAAALGVTVVSAQQQPPPPAAPASAAPQLQGVFRSGVELVRVDVQVVSGEGHPMLELGINDFNVGIDGDKRRVVSAELVQFAKPDPTSPENGPIRTPGTLPEDARVFIIAVDQMGFPTGEIQRLRTAIRHFIDQLRPQDLVALYTFPFRTPQLALTHDHLAVERAVDKIVGLRDSKLGVFNLTPSEIVEITAADRDTISRVVLRECSPNDATCPPSVEAEATSLAGYMEAESVERLHGFETLIQGLSYLPGRKTVVLLSGGLLSTTRTTGRPDVTGLISAVGTDTANSQTNLYVLHWDTTFNDSFSAVAPASLNPADRFESAFADRDAMGRGLEFIAGKAGGALFRVEAGNGNFVFDRVLRETTAYYLLGVEPTDDDRDGKLHYIRVGVNKKGATVRARTQVVIPRIKAGQ